VAVRVLGTGTRIDVADDQSGVADLTVQVEPFAELEVDGAARRYGGGHGFAELELDTDPTTQLVEAAHIQRELNLGNLLGDMKIGARLDITRFELYSAPFRIELTDRLRAHLAGRWKGRDPRADAWEWSHPKGDSALRSANSDCCRLDRALIAMPFGQRHPLGDRGADAPEPDLAVDPLERLRGLTTDVEGARASARKRNLSGRHRRGSHAASLSRKPDAAASPSSAPRRSRRLGPSGRYACCRRQKSMSSCRVGSRPSSIRSASRAFVWLANNLSTTGRLHVKIAKFRKVLHAT